MTFSTLYGDDYFFFSGWTAGNPTVDYKVWANRMRVPFLQFFMDLGSLGAAKSLALVFAFQTPAGGRILLYSDAGLISDQVLAPNDNQLLLEIESLDYFNLYFIHVGGEWFFKGLSGYVV